MDFWGMHLKAKKMNGLYHEGKKEKNPRWEREGETGLLVFLNLYHTMNITHHHSFIMQPLLWSLAHLYLHCTWLGVPQNNDVSIAGHGLDRVCQRFSLLAGWGGLRKGEHRATQTVHGCRKGAAGTCACLVKHGGHHLPLCKNSSGLVFLFFLPSPNIIPIATIQLFPHLEDVKTALFLHQHAQIVCDVKQVRHLVQKTGARCGEAA